MAVVYLDDSGTHGPSPVATMAGYVFQADEWERFERSASAFMGRKKVPVFHARKFDKRKSGSPFAGWGTVKQTFFIDEWLDIAKDHALRGVTISLPKASYEKLRKESRKNQNISLYGQCFNDLLNELVNESEVWALAQKEGLSVMLEIGNKNNAGIVEFFKRVRKDKGWEKELPSIGEVAKESCVAIQLADFLAYYSWQYAHECFTKSIENVKEMPAFLDVATLKIRTIGQLGSGFEVASPSQKKKS